VQAKAVAEAAAAIIKENSKACPMVLSGVQGVNSVINGLYLPTQETGQDGRVLYRKSGESGDQALCIEHFEGEWQVKAESHRFSGIHVASVEGGCVLEDCRESNWRVYNSAGKLKVQDVKIMTEEEANAKVSDHDTLTLQISAA
jgi:hypothetical protein